MIAALCALTVLGCTGGAFASAPGLDPAGVVHYAKPADSGFDRFTKAPTAAQQAWMRTHYWRMRAYSPYFDTRTSWYADAWFYKDSYALYVSSALAAEHPEWILRDAAGNKLFIQFGCHDGLCPQYAADIGSPDFRARWIADARAALAHGYRGIFIDDVNMEMRVSDGSGRAVAPIDPRTGRPMTLAAWRRYMADFMVQVRAALPNAEIVHNALWFDGDADPDVARELHAADLVEIERGVEDSGLTGGTGKYGLRTLLGFIDRRHADGQGVILDAHSGTTAGRLYGLAAYFLVSSGRDALADTPGGTPDDWWAAGYDTNLGTALGPRYRTAEGVWRRDFTGGTVLLNEPGAPARTVALPAGLRDLGGVARSAVTLGPASGAVLVGAGAPRAPANGTSTTVTVAPAPAARRRSSVLVSYPTLKRVSHRYKLRVSGRVRGARAGWVDIVVQRHGAHGWVRVRRARAQVAAGGRFRVTVSARPGRYRLRAWFRGSRAANPSRSRYRRFSVRG
ncbi:MAG TPA: putative glycoside hydrolase [Solirubrobacteraceae bacterium]